MRIFALLAAILLVASGLADPSLADYDDVSGEYFSGEDDLDNGPEDDIDELDEDAYPDSYHEEDTDLEEDSDDEDSDSSVDPDVESEVDDSTEENTEEVPEEEQSEDTTDVNETPATEDLDAAPIVNLEVAESVEQTPESSILAARQAQGAALEALSARRKAAQAAADAARAALAKLGVEEKKAVVGESEEAQKLKETLCSQKLEFWRHENLNAEESIKSRVQQLNALSSDLSQAQNAVSVALDGVAKVQKQWTIEKALRDRQLSMVDSLLAKTEAAQMSKSELKIEAQAVAQLNALSSDDSTVSRKFNNIMELLSSAKPDTAVAKSLLVQLRGRIVKEGERAAMDVQRREDLVREATANKNVKQLAVDKANALLNAARHELEVGRRSLQQARSSCA